jgi:hypothetical protein
MRSETEWVAWAREHRVAFEVAPLLEVKGDAKVQIGFTLSLWAAAPSDRPPGPEQEGAVRKLWEELRALAETAVPVAERTAAAEIEPPHTAVLRPENDCKPEVGLTWRLFHRDDYLAPVTGADRDRLAVVEKRLMALGLKQGRW